MLVYSTFYEVGGTMKDTIEVNDLSVSYAGHTALQNVSFSMKTGQLIGIIGPNGAGKSTLMKAMLGFIQRDQGEIFITGKKVNKVRKNIAYVAQRNNIDWDFPILVKDTVLLGTYPNLGLFRRPGKKEKQWAQSCLEKVGMLDYADRQISELSGGQQQRVFLARALAQETEFFFLDEPFVGIDVASEQMIMTILKSLRDEGKTVFIVHHDLSKVVEYFDQVILINKKLIAAGAVEEVMNPEQVSAAYEMDFRYFAGIGGNT